MTPAQIAAKITPSLQEALLTTVDALMRRRACDIPEQTIDQLVALGWLQWKNDSLRLTEAGKTMVVKVQNAMIMHEAVTA